MCGIAGGNGSPSAQELRSIAVALQHRGPDDSGIWQQQDTWLLNTRLAIQDLSPAGHQPMHSADKRYSLVFNGEIFNHRELRARYCPGDHFTSGSDTETLLHCWMRLGEGCLDVLDGDFAFAVFDRQRRELFLARDRMGVKPLYWYFDGRQFAFASELPALLRLPGLDLGLDVSAFGNYLLYQYNPDERTPFARIRKLAPSHTLRFGPELAEPRIRRYYRLPYGGSHPHQPESQWEEQTWSALQHAVTSQLLSDAPLALTLSGGLDSALVAAIARNTDARRPLTAYCIDTRGGMAAEGFAEDAGYAKLAATHLGLDLRLIPGDYDLQTEIDAMVLALGEPQADPAAINIRLIARAAHADGFKVLLGGTGADDLFSGYRRHQLLRYHRLLKYLPAAVGKLRPRLAGLALRHPSVRRLEKVLGTAGRPELDASIHSFFWNEPAALDALFLEPVASLRRPYALFHELLAEIPGETSLLNLVLFLEQRSFLPHHNLAYMDKLAMAESVEMRVPFADRRLVETAAALPPGLKLRGRETKYILRSIGRRMLPAQIVDRPKTGFAYPLRSWVRGPGAAVIRERLLDPSFLQNGIFSPTSVTTFVQQSLNGQRDGAYTLFSLLCIESWLRQFTARP